MYLPRLQTLQLGLNDDDFELIESFVTFFFDKDNRVKYFELYPNREEYGSDHADDREEEIAKLV